MPGVSECMVHAAWAGVEVRLGPLANTLHLLAVQLYDSDVGVAVRRALNLCAAAACHHCQHHMQSEHCAAEL